MITGWVSWFQKGQNLDYVILEWSLLNHIIYNHAFFGQVSSRILIGLILENLIKLTQITMLICACGGDSYYVLLDSLAIVIPLFDKIFTVWPENSK